MGFQINSSSVEFSLFEFHGFVKNKLIGVH